VQKKHGGRTTGSTGITPAFPAQWFTAYIALSSATGLSCHRHRRICIHPLDASVGASGPHDFAVRLKRHSSKALPASTASRPTSVTIASAPLGDGTAESIKLRLAKREAKYFCGRGWTRSCPDSPPGKSHSREIVATTVRHIVLLDGYDARQSCHRPAADRLR
jgi:hypothetical protein